jgi:hypothetical protein
MGKRLRRYNQSNKSKQQNRQFSLNQKQFYNILHEKSSSGPTPNKTAMENYWKTLWGTPVNHNEQENWLNEEVLSSESIPSMTQVQITISDIQ